jgi:aspartate aminotransferase
MRVEFEARRDLIVRLLNEVPGFECNVPHGAFYAFPKVTGALKEGETDIELASWLLEEAKVAVVPGSVFEGVGHIRLSYATSRKNIEEGVRRIKQAIVDRTG